tara:strand:+ start:618 stop:1025 length:408 start_codon:yes stop_codon:yes gene_type:complete
MHLEILRQEYLEKQTLGFLYIVDGDIAFSCNTLELPWKENKQNISCVPTGEYKCKFEYSDRFNRYLWELKDVPNRSECKFHSANYFRQLNGCIALGDSFKDIDGDGWRDVSNSVETMRKFHNELNGLTEITLIIK